MDITTLFYLTQAIALSVYLTLAIYVALSRSTRPIHRPFVAFALIEAFDAFSHFLLRYPGGAPQEIPLILRLRWAALAFLPAIFLHMFLPLIQGKPRRYARILTWGTYALGAITALGMLLEDVLITDMIYRGPEGADLIDAIFHPSRIILVTIWAGFALLAATGFLIYASKDASRPRIQADASRLIAPWILLVIALILGTVISTLPVDASSSLRLFLDWAARILSIVAGLLLARGVLRFGSPAGQPIHYSLAPIILPLLAIVIIDFALVYDTESATSALYLLRVSLISMVVGMLLARPELLQRVARWLGPPPPDETKFAVKLHISWENLAKGTYNITQVSETLIALQDQIQAEYVGLLELMDVSEDGELTFGRWEDGPRLFLRGGFIDWPLTEDDLVQTAYRVANLPGSPNLILPIHDEQNLVGVLVIGEPMRGGEYATGDLMLGELLSSQISFALAHGLRLEEALGMPHEVETEPASLPNVNVAIRSFGRLEVYTQGADPRTNRPSLRARQILAILLAAYPDPVPAETLMNHLWPEHAQQAAANSLYVAIYTLRRSLEPGLQRGEVSRYIHRDGDCYQLMIDKDLWIDYLEFERLYRQGKALEAGGNRRACIHTYERAIRVFRRNFLPEAILDLPVEVEVTRHRLQLHLHEIAQFLAQESLRVENYAEAERVLLHLLSIDPHDQAARVELVRVYRVQGKEGLAREVELQIE
ncbi:MAG: hypothetical protein GTO18_09590, partial [Anaerolineales bacterium]|nr:hypothetical protein [Anaerolineales bacterium]